MFWDRKKKDAVSELPAAPPVPNLRAFGLNASSWKEGPPRAESVHDEMQRRLPLLPHTQHTEPMSTNENVPSIREFHEQTESPSPEQPFRTREQKPIFVRIDKVQAAHQTLAQLKELLADADKLVKNIREIKQREDQELAAWEQEVQTARARIAAVITELFEPQDQG